MKHQDQIKALAELDGWKLENYGPVGYETLYWRLIKPDGTIRESNMCGEDWVRSVCVGFYPPYLTSRDAIVPVIEKWAINESRQEEFIEQIDLLLGKGQRIGDWCDLFFKLLTATPAQLSEALLRATGKWVD